MFLITVYFTKVICGYLDSKPMEKLSEKNSFLAKINEVIFHKGVKGKVVYRIYPSLGRGPLQTRTEWRIERRKVVYRIYPSLGRGALQTRTERRIERRKVVYRIYPSLGRGPLQTRTTVAERRIERNNFKIVTFLIIYQSLVWEAKF